jgi:3-oxoacyl-[acyl-carrier protein] reductase
MGDGLEAKDYRSLEYRPLRIRTGPDPPRPHRSTAARLSGDAEAAAMAATDRVALVTGAGRGIGRAVALALAGEGYRVALVARTGPELEEVAREIEGDGGEALVVSTDLADAASAEAAVQRAVERFGRLDVLVNNAGAADESDFGALSVDAIDRVLDVTLRATVLMTRAALPHLLRAPESAAVVQVASLAGRRPAAGISVYAAAKHGVLGFSESFFEELRETGLKVSSILPGLVDTRMVEGSDAQRARMIAPEDVAQAVLYVLSTSPRVCPAELVLRPQRSPFKA